MSCLWKARFFRARIAEHGIALEIPDLAPDFTHMTVTGMLAVVEAILARGPAVLLGSSLGGYLAALARWREDGTAPVHHYGLGRDLPLAIGLLDDARRYPEEPDPTAPALVHAGRHDEAVPLAAVERFARARPGRELAVYDSGHELTDVLEPMWERTEAFLRRLGALG